MSRMPITRDVHVTILYPVGTATTDTHRSSEAHDARNIPTKLLSFKRQMTNFTMNYIHMHHHCT